MLKIKFYNMLRAFLLLTILPATVAAENVIEGDVVISEEMFLQELAMLTKQARDRYLSSMEKTVSMLDDIYQREKMVEEALRRNLDKDPLFTQRVEKARKQLLLIALEKDIRDKIEYPDFVPLAKEKYLTNKDKYRTQPQIRVRHILIEKGKDLDPEQQKQKLEDILVKAKAGESFEELAKAYSDDGSASKTGGDIGWFGYGKTVKPFEKAAFALAKPGDISDIVETQYGFHIIKLEDVRPSEAIPYEKVSASIILQLTQEYERNKLKLIHDVLKNPKDSKLNAAAMDSAYKQALKEFGK